MPQPAPAPPDDFFELLRQASHKEITAEASEAALAKMLGAGANPNKIDSGGWSVLLTCCSCSTLTHWVPRLIAAGADPNFQSAPRQFDRSHNPLALAFGSNKRSLARFLISHGADPAKSVREGISVECAGVVTRNYNPISVALIAAWLGDAPLLARALASGDDPDLADQSHGLPRTPLNLAALHRDPACLRLLLEHGADPNSRADQGAGPLHMAAKAGLAGNIELLLRAGADIQAGPGKALHMAVEGGHAECVLLLGKAGADLESLDSERRTPAQLAVLSSRKAGGPCLEALISLGLDLNAAQPDGDSLAMLAAQKVEPEWTRALALAGADFGSLDDPGSPLSLMRGLEEPDDEPLSSWIMALVESRRIAQGLRPAADGPSDAKATRIHRAL